MKKHWEGSAPSFRPMYARQHGVPVQVMKALIYVRLPRPRIETEVFPIADSRSFPHLLAFIHGAQDAP